jgi:hypothetical protein
MCPVGVMDMLHDFLEDFIKNSLQMHNQECYISAEIKPKLHYLPSKEIRFFDISGGITVATKPYLIVISHFSPCPLLL